MEGLEPESSPTGRSLILGEPRLSQIDHAVSSDDEESEDADIQGNSIVPEDGSTTYHGKSHRIMNEILEANVIQVIQEVKKVQFMICAILALLSQQGHT